MSQELKDTLVAQGYFPQPFIPGGEHAPEEHFTWRGLEREARQWKLYMEQARTLLLEAGFAHVNEHVFDGRHSPIFQGYIEAERIRDVCDLPETPFTEANLQPFRTEKASVLHGKFRHGELHLRMDAQKSHPRIAEILTEAGFHPVHMEKPWGIAAIWTLQYATQACVRELFEHTKELCLSHGGIVRGQLKEEVIVDYLLSDPDTPVPPAVISF